jgi:hypothetical protein
VLKKRNPSAGGGQRRPGAPSTGSRYAQGGNISSNRDTEELTPYPQDASDSEDYGGKHRDTSAGQVAGRYAQEHNYGSYDASEVQDEDPDLYRAPMLQQQDSLASIEEEALASGGGYEREEYYSNSRNNSGDSRDPYRHNAPSYVAGRGSMKEGAAYTRPKTQSRDTGASVSARTTTSGMKKSSSDFGRADVATAAAVSGQGRVLARRDVSTSHSSAHPTASHHSGAASGGLGPVAVERRVKPYPTEKKSVSASVRRTAPLPAVESQHRPYTSKASFTGSTAPSAHPVASGSGSRNSSAGSHHSQGYGGEGTDSDGDGDDVWLCLKCGRENSNSDYCPNCATVRGSDGKRGTTAVLHKH